MTRNFIKNNWIAITLGSLALAASAIIIFVPRHQAMTVRESMSRIIQKLPPEKQSEEWLKAEKEIAAIGNTARTTLAQIIGGVALLFGLYFTYQNAKTAQQTLRVTEDGKITDRFSKAVELLGNANLDVRLGGIYALERIARDSKNDHWTIMEILTTYVREHAPVEGFQPPKPGVKFDKTLPTDIQAILDVIVRRKWRKSETHNQIINLSKTDLSVANLQGANLEGVNLHQANLSWASLDNANLNRAILGGATLRAAILRFATLRRAYLEGANLEKAHFTEAILEDADLTVTKLTGTIFRLATLRRATLVGANLERAVLDRANLEGVDLTEVECLTWEQIKTAIIDEKTLLPPNLESIRLAEQKNKNLES